MLPGKISTQVAFMESHPECSICYHDLEVFDSDTGRLLYHYSQQQQPRTGGLREVIRFSTFNGACSNMVRRSAAPAHGFDNRFPVASDWLYWIETLSGGGRIEYLDHVLGRYRRHAGNVTGEPGINRAYLDHIATCVVLLIMFPHLQRDVRQILSDNLYGNRGASQEATLGWLSLGVHFRFGRLRCLLREWARRRLMTR